MRKKLLAVAIRNSIFIISGGILGACLVPVHAHSTNKAETNKGSMVVWKANSVTSPNLIAENKNKLNGGDSPKNESSGAQNRTKSNATKLSAITVTGTLGSLMRSENTKRTAINVVDSISAEEAGKFPDQTVAEALQRVPGVSINRGGDESNQITVRGFGPQFQTTLLNGRRVASATGDRAFNFDTLPVELLKQAVVQKSSSADTPSGGIGATINIKTWQPLDFNGFHFNGTAEASYSDIPDEPAHKKVTPRVSLMLGDTSKNGSFGWLISADYYKNDRSSVMDQSAIWIHPQFPLLKHPPKRTAYIPGQTDYWVINDTQISRAINGAIEWKPTTNLTLTGNYLYTELNSQSHSFVFGLFRNPQVITSLTTDKNGTATHFVENKSGALSDDQIMTYGPSDERITLAGFHLNYRINENNILNFDASFSKAWNKQAGRGYWTVLGTRNIGVTPTLHNNGYGPSSLPYYTNILNPASQVNNLRAHFDEFGDGESFGGGQANHSDKVNDLKINFKHYFNDSAITFIKAGFARTHHRVKSIAFADLFECVAYCGYVVKVPASAVDAHVKHFGTLLDGAGKGPNAWVVYNPYKLFAYLRTPAAYNQLPENVRKTLVQKLAANRGFTPIPQLDTFSRITEHDTAAYIQAGFEGYIGDLPWKLQAGVRFVTTKTTSAAYSIPLLSVHTNPLDPTNQQPVFGKRTLIQANGKYHELLPSLNFRINVRPDVILRFAASKSMSRPPIGDLSAATSYDFRPNNQTVTKGNTDLKPFVSTNFDIGGGWFYGKASYIALDYFYKKVKNFDTVSTSRTIILGLPFLLSQPINLNTAVVRGVEVTWNDHFTFLPSPFDGLGVATNYTFVSSDQAISGATLITGEKFGIPGIGNSYNASLFYQKGKWQARLAYNWRASYVSSVGGGGNLPTDVAAYGELDLSMSYKLNNHFQLFFDATNLNNEMIYSYQVYRNRPVQLEADGRTFLLGLHYNM